MTRDFLTPELEGLLLEVASDPKSRFAQRPFKRRACSLVGMREPVSASAVSATKAERHLLQVYRDEVATLLREASVSASLAGPQAQANFYATPERRKWLAHLGSGAWTSGARRTLEGARQRVALGSTADLLARWIGPARGSASATELARASFVIVPRDRTRRQLASCMVTEENWDEAFALIDEVLSHRPEPLVAYATLTTLGRAEARCGRRPAAAAAYQSAAGSECSSPYAPAQWFALAARFGQRDSCLRALARFEELAPIDPDVGPVSSDSWCPSEATSALLRSLRQTVSPICRRLVDAHL